MDEEFLKFGDQICLFSDTAYGYLTSMSFNAPDVYLQQCSKLHSSHTYNMRNMAFKVVPKLGYDSYKDHRREVKAVKARESIPNLTGAPEENVLLMQQKWETHERRMNLNKINNDKYIDMMNKRKVTYGMPIQLMHVDSGYFLTMTKSLSQTDRSC